jgi:hypothetical protein
MIRAETQMTSTSSNQNKRTVNEPPQKREETLEMKEG